MNEQAIAEAEARIREIKGRLNAMSLEAARVQGVFTDPGVAAVKAALVLREAVFRAEAQLEEHENPEDPILLHAPHVRALLAEIARLRDQSMHQASDMRVDGVQAPERR